MVLVGLQLHQQPHAPNPPGVAVGVAVGLVFVGVEQQAPMAAAVVVGVWKLAARLVLEVGVQLPNWGVGVGVVV